MRILRDNPTGVLSAFQEEAAEATPEGVVDFTDWQHQTEASANWRKESMAANQAVISHITTKTDW
jgi:hypothetical protein